MLGQSIIRTSTRTVLASRYLPKQAVSFQPKLLSSAHHRKYSSGFDYPFDTHKFVKALEAKGFTTEQAEVISESLQTIVKDSTSSVSKNMVSKTEIDVIKRDMQVLEKSEFNNFKSDNDKLKADVVKLHDQITKLREQLNDEILKLKSGVRLDFSLEKGRIREEATVQDLKIKDTNNKIDTEIAAVKTQIESMKVELMKFVGGTILSIITVTLGYLRFFKS
eukprot:Colp12_sorted_trinity150504_noHs@23492